MLYEKATKLPPFSTPTGIMFLLVLKMRQTIEFQKSRALVQSMMSQKESQDEQIKKVFEEMREAFFPFDKNQKGMELKKMKDAMNYWVKHGPVVMEVQDDGKQSRKMATKLVRGQQNLEQRLHNEKQGKTQGLNPFQKARRRPRGAS